MMIEKILLNSSDYTKIMILHVIELWNDEICSHYYWLSRVLNNLNTVRHKILEEIVGELQVIRQNFGGD